MADPTPAVTLAALRDLLSQVTTSAGRPVQVKIGPGRDLEDQVLMLGDVVGDQEWSHIGARKRDEDYTIELYVLVAVPGDDDLEAAQRAWGLFAQVSNLLRQPENVALASSAGVLWNELKNPTGVPTVETEGHGYAIESAVRFRTRI